MADGRDTLFDIDWQGGQQIKNSHLGREVVSIFILPPSFVELERRLRARGQDSAQVIAGRMARAMDEASHWPEYDYVMVNFDLDETDSKVRSIVTAERVRRERQLWLPDFMRGLAAEFQETAR
jgi:guanylate kinase